MYASNPSRKVRYDGRIDSRLSRLESYSARSARRRALERETDTELRLAVRGTWIEFELRDAEDDE